MWVPVDHFVQCTGINDWSSSCLLQVRYVHVPYLYSADCTDIGDPDRPGRTMSARSPDV